MKNVEMLPYMVEYTVDNTCTKALNYTDYLGDVIGLPFIRIAGNTSDSGSWENYEAIEITLLDGTTTTDVTTTCDKVAKVKLWYPKNTDQISWWGGEVNNFYLYESQITSIKYYNTSNFTSMKHSHCHKLTNLDISNLDTRNMTNMSLMFYYCKSLTSLDLSNFDTSNVTNMNNMFIGSTSLTSLDISNWNINNVSTMSTMFDGCSSLNNIIMNNSDYNSINKITSALPTKEIESNAVLNIENAYKRNEVNFENLKNKNWIVYYRNKKTSIASRRGNITMASFVGGKFSSIH